MATGVIPDVALEEEDAMSTGHFPSQSRPRTKLEDPEWVGKLVKSTFHGERLILTMLFDCLTIQNGSFGVDKKAPYQSERRDCSMALPVTCSAIHAVVEAALGSTTWQDQRLQASVPKGESFRGSRVLRLRASDVNVAQFLGSP